MPSARTVRSATAVLGGAAVLALAPAAPASAHEKYFLRDGYATDWSFFFSPITLTLVLLVVIAAAAWRVVGRRVGHVELKPLARLAGLAPYIPRLLAIHLGVSLLALAVLGQFLAPSIELHHLPASTVLGVLEGALGVWFISGINIRPATVVLALVGPVSLFAIGPVGLLESMNIVGVAAFLFLVPPSATGRYGAVTPSRDELRRALLALRVLVGGALIVLAFSEKLANPGLARAIIAQHSQLNVLGLFGIHNVDLFIRIAGATEILFGLLVISGAMPQVAVLVAAIPFNLTLLLFGTTELIGHLPVYGVFLALLVYGSAARTAPDVSYLPKPRAKTTRVADAASPSVL
ncbi:MAG: hypothetical protein QOG52_2910 [Frankiaceae bacterium]|nr:hypothetical protein [Frankiaceae bacterium]